MKDNNISIIICTYNRAHLLKHSLQTLLNQKTEGLFSYEILVIDDKSTDNTRDVVNKIGKYSKIPIRYLRGTGKGISNARNFGIENTMSEWVAFFDDDQIAQPYWLGELYKCAIENNVNCVGGTRLLNLSKNAFFDLSPIVRKILGEIKNGGTQKKCKRKEYPAAGNILLKRNVFEIVGRFDESLLRGGEDIEFAQRLRKKGFVAWYTPKSICYHEVTAYRLSKEYLIWSSLRAGDNFSFRDYLEWGLLKTIVATFARMGQAFTINLLRLFLAKVKYDENDKIGIECLIWRSIGYFFHTLHLIFPKAFPLKKYFSRIEFRKERETFQKEKVL